MIDSVAKRNVWLIGRALAAAALLTLSACGSHQPKPATEPTVISVPSGVNPVRRPPLLADPNIVTIWIYRITLPYGAASKNNAFWKLLDEDLIDVPNYALLNENGIRVGRGRVADWNAFRNVLDKYSAAYKWVAITGYSGEKNVPDYPMTGPFQTETLFVYDQHGANGRDYPLCTNLFSFACAWAPRKKDTMRLTICPIVQCVREQNIWPFDLDSADIAMNQTENQYELGLTADIGKEEFLAIGASSAADNPLTIGHQFLTGNGKTQRTEDLLILIQKPVELSSPSSPNAPATRPAALPAK